jgi:hypothetical protein
LKDYDADAVRFQLDGRLTIPQRSDGLSRRLRAINEARP